VLLFIYSKAKVENEELFLFGGCISHTGRAYPACDTFCRDKTVYVKRCGKKRAIGKYFLNESI